RHCGVRPNPAHRVRPCRDPAGLCWRPSRVVANPTGPISPRPRLAGAAARRPRDRRLPVPVEAPEPGDPMRAASLLCVLVLAKLCMATSHSVEASAWAPVAYLWQDLLLVVLFAGFDALVRRSWLGWTAYGLIVAYAAVNVPVARVLGTPLTAPMLRATRGTLADSVAHHATPANIGLVLLVLTGAAVSPLLFRRIRGRRVIWGAVFAAPVILL